MTLYLHIGLHKTGTSSLQNFLGRNAPALAEAGYHWPRAGLVAGGHHNLGYELMSKGRFSAEAGGLEALKAELEGAGNAIVSSEELEFLELAEVRRLREGLGGRPVRVIAYLRRQDELIAATYAQQVRMGANMATFPEYALQSLYQPRFDFSQLVLRWAGVFGREALDISVTHEGTAGAALFVDFTSRIGVPAPADGWRFPARRLNVSPSANEVELIRRTTRLLRRGGRRTTPEGMKPILRTVAARVAADPSLQTGKLVLEADMLERAANRFGAGNRRVAGAYVTSIEGRAALEWERPVASGGRLAPGPRLARIAAEIVEAVPKTAEFAHG